MHISILARLPHTGEKIRDIKIHNTCLNNIQQHSNFIAVRSIPKGTYLLEIQDLQTAQKVVEKILVGLGIGNASL